MEILKIVDIRFVLEDGRVLHASKLNQVSCDIRQIERMMPFGPVEIADYGEVTRELEYEITLKYRVTASGVQIVEPRIDIGLGLGGGYRGSDV